MAIWRVRNALCAILLLRRLEGFGHFHFAPSVIQVQAYGICLKLYYAALENLETLRDGSLSSRPQAMAESSKLDLVSQ